MESMLLTIANLEKVAAKSGAGHRLSYKGGTWMSSQIGRRDFLACAAGIGGLAFLQIAQIRSPLKVAVISDEISQDFGRVCEVISHDFGMSWIELRELWNKNIVNLDAKEEEEARRILKKYQLSVTDIASPLFKADWPGAPRSKFSTTGDQFNSNFSFDQQGEVLDRSLSLAKTFQTNRVRCFDFWRLDDPGPYRAGINEMLQKTAEKAAGESVILMLENEPSCNTATGAESAKVLSAIKSRNLMLNWDPGNAAYHGEIAYPDGYNLLPKDRIGHCHCKDAVKKAGSENDYDWAAMGRGVIDWVGQFRALKQDGYHYAVSLETHWRGAGTPEASSRESWAGMKEEMRQAGVL
jgi:sugar phosphate isomerase/epimerase